MDKINEESREELQREPREEKQGDGVGGGRNQ